MARSAKPAPPTCDLDRLTALALDAWNRQGEADASEGGARWRFYPEHSPSACLVMECAQGPEKITYRRVSSPLMGADDVGQRVRDLLASMADD